MSVEDRLVQTLTSHAEGPVDTANLLTGSVARGRTLRRRHAGAVALATAAVLGVAVAVPLAAWPDRVGQKPAALPPSASPTPGSSLPLPPAVTGAQTLLDNPAVLGSDPTLLHLSADSAPPRPTPLPTGGMFGDATPTTSWASWAGSEYLSLQWPITVDFSAGQFAAHEITGLVFDRDLTINGRPAKLYRSSGGGSSPSLLVAWEPVPGVPVAARGINGTTEAVLIAAAEGLRFDRVSRCAAAFEVTTVPAGATLYRCDASFTASGVAPNSRLVYRKSDGSVLDIRDRATDPLGETPDTTVAGHPAHWGAGDAQGVDGDILTVAGVGGHNVWLLINGSFTRAEAEQVVAGLTWS